MSTFVLLSKVKQYLRGVWSKERRTLPSIFCLLTVLNEVNGVPIIINRDERFIKNLHNFTLNLTKGIGRYIIDEIFGNVSSKTF